MSETQFHIIAHRGWRSECPENTLAAFSAALNHGFPHFETDAQLTQDGACIIFHDDCVDRTTNSTGQVAMMQFSEIKALDAGSWFSKEFTGEKVPTLEEVVEQFAPRSHIHLELKSQQEGLADAVAKVLQAHLQPHIAAGGTWDVPGITVTSFHLEQLQRSRQLLPDLRHSWLVQEITLDVVEACVEAGISQLCPRANAVTSEVVARATAAGLSIRCWGVKDVALIERIVDAGVQGATIDWPHAAVEALAALKRSPS